MRPNACRAVAGAMVMALCASALPAGAQQQRQPPPAAPAASQTPLVRPPGAPAQRVAILQGLDKVTARTQRIVVPLGSAVRFGTLAVTVQECLVNAPDAPPESASHLTIVDNKPGNPPVTLFTGWMFASAPALYGLDHSVYDVIVLACSTAAQAAAPSTSR
jgi:hypothetical protein